MESSGPASSTASDEGLAISAQTRLLVVAPHPDDETIATGVLIQRVLAAGGQVHIQLLTDGDNNPWPQRWLERRLRVRVADRERWGRRRQAEMQLALQRLGLSPTALQALHWPDQGVTTRLLQSAEAAKAELLATIRDIRPNLLAVPALGDRHPDHGAAHVLVRMALAGQEQPPRLLAYLVHGQHPVGTTVIDMRASADEQRVKQLALAAYHSQMVLSGERMRRLASRPECHARVSMVEGESSMILPWQPPRWMRPWLRLSVVDAAGARCWAWRKAPLQRDGQGRYHLQGQPRGVTPCFARLTLEWPSPWIFDHWGWCEL